VLVLVLSEAVLVLGLADGDETGFSIR